LDYCMEEIEDMTIGDSFKSVIVAAYATVSPQRAYVLSQEIADWGGGNSWTNSLFFISTQPSTTYICLPMDQKTPEGLYIMQDMATGLYVTLDIENKLTATAAVDVLAARFQLEYKPGGGTILALHNGKYVSADSSGVNDLAAAKDTASLYELFRWYPQNDQVYHLRALSNKGFVGTRDDEHLVNNGTATNYRLTLVDGAPPPGPPAQGKFRNVATNNFVRATEADTTLRVGANDADATIWAYERVPESPDAEPLYAIRSTTTNMYVTADPTGASPLKATNQGAGAWEQFQFLPFQGNYILIHAVTGNAVHAMPDGTLVDNNLIIDQNAQWTIV